MSNVKPFAFEDLDRTCTDEAKLIMADTILAWADLDTGISYLTLLVFGLDFDAGSILVGNMDLKTKVERLKALFSHHDMSGADGLAFLITQMREFSDCRNTIAHRKWVGRMFSDPDRQVFTSARHIKGQPGQYEIKCVDVSEFAASAKFARQASVQVGEMIDIMEASRKNAANGEA